jgi:hypothetical protein
MSDGNRKAGSKFNLDSAVEGEAKSKAQALRRFSWVKII